MNKRIFKFAAIIMIFSLLTACSSESFMDLSIFVRLYGDEDEIEIEDFYVEKDEEGNYIFYTFFEEENSTVMLKLICDIENKIDEVRIYLPKTDENGNEKAVATDDICLFTEVVASSIKAYTYYSDEETESILKEMCLYDKKAYSDEGELTKTKGNFYFIYLSSHLGSEVMIYNTYLKTIEETEKPESRPLYGETTNIRQDTVPLE